MAVLVFGAHFLVLFWRSKKVGNKTFPKENSLKDRTVPFRETLLGSIKGWPGGADQCPTALHLFAQQMNKAEPENSCPRFRGAFFSTFLAKQK